MSRTLSHWSFNSGVDITSNQHNYSNVYRINVNQADSEVEKKGVLEFTVVKCLCHHAGFGTTKTLLFINAAYQCVV